jgi:hypothetical protein
MNWKQLVYKVGKGAVTGALGSMASLTVAGMDPKQIGPMATAAVLSGVLHGITNALEQAKG